MTYPRLEARDLLTATDAGPRVSLGALYASFDERERLAWERYAGTARLDEFGILPDGLERFYERTTPDRQQTLFGEPN